MVLNLLHEELLREMVDTLQYKLRMLGIPLKGHARMMCDNASVVYNGSFPESTIKKKHLSICYHCVHESVASKKIQLIYERSKSNIADLLTKVLTPNLRKPLIDSVLS